MPEIQQRAQQVKDQFKAIDAHAEDFGDRAKNLAPELTALANEVQTESRATALRDAKAHLDELKAELKMKWDERDLRRGGARENDNEFAEVRDFETALTTASERTEQRLRATETPVTPAGPNTPFTPEQLQAATADFIPPEQLARQGGIKQFFGAMSGKAIAGLVTFLRFIKGSGASLLGLGGGDAAQRQENERILNTFTQVADRLTGAPEIKIGNYRGIIEQALDPVKVVPGRNDAAAARMIESKALNAALDPAKAAYDGIEADLENTFKPELLARTPAPNPAQVTLLMNRERTARRAAAQPQIIESYINDVLVPLYQERCAAGLTLTIGPGQQAQITLDGVVGVLKTPPVGVKPTVVTPPPAAERSIFGFGRRQQPAGNQRPQPRP